MIVNAAVKEIINNCSPFDEIMTCVSQDYYNSGNPKTRKVVDIVKENGKLIILTQ